MSRFKEFTTDELLAEIVRRRNARVDRRPIAKCDECKNFKPSMTASDSYNPCQKKHEMRFKTPSLMDLPDTDDWGFYRNCCPDRDSE